MVAHARTDHPDEACGVLPGRRDPTSRRIVEMMNAERSPTFYRFDSGEQLKVWRAMDDADEVPVVIYHSHTATDPYPSRTDSGLAAEPDAHYVPRRDSRTRRRPGCSYRIVDGVITAEPITVVDSGDGAARVDLTCPTLIPAHPAHNH